MRVIFSDIGRKHTGFLMRQKFRKIYNSYVHRRITEYRNYYTSFRRIESVAAQFKRRSFVKTGL
jgi:hypothetical protein